MRNRLPELDVEEARPLVHRDGGVEERHRHLVGTVHHDTCAEVALEGVGAESEVEGVAYVEDFVGSLFIVGLREEESGHEQLLRLVV